MEMWVLYERTDLQHGGEWDYQNYRSKSWAFSSFETAKAAMRKRITELAREKNSMFPEGRLEVRCLDDEESSAVNCLTGLVNSILRDENYELGKHELESVIEEIGIESVDADFDAEGFTNYLWGFGVTNEEEPQLICHGYDDGPCNGYNPYIYINCFTMNDPDKKYSFHIEDGFEYDDFRNHLFLDLEKVMVDEY